jgi:hypothetical protein
MTPFVPTDVESKNRDIVPMTSSLKTGRFSSVRWSTVEASRFDVASARTSGRRVVDRDLRERRERPRDARRGRRTSSDRQSDARGLKSVERCENGIAAGRHAREREFAVLIRRGGLNRSCLRSQFDLCGRQDRASLIHNGTRHTDFGTALRGC